MPPNWAAEGLGGRFNDPDGRFRVVYASSQRLGCFLETLACFRPNLTAAAELAEVEGEDDYPAHPISERNWCELRFIGSAAVAGRFADITGEDWTAKLRIMMAGDCLEAGLPDFDVSVTLGPKRKLTQIIAGIVYGLGYEGIRYPSRHAAGIENWALFEPMNIVADASFPISKDDPDLLRALEILQLRLADQPPEEFSASSAV